MLVRPHTTSHGANQAKKLEAKQTATFKVVKRHGLDTDEVSLLALTAGLIDYAEEKGLKISPYALWFTPRESKKALAVAEARKLLKTAKSEGHEFDLAPAMRRNKDGEMHPNRHAGRIRIGPEWVKPTHQRQAEELEDLDLETRKFLKIG